MAQKIDILNSIIDCSNKIKLRNYQIANQTIYYGTYRADIKKQNKIIYGIEVSNSDEFDGNYYEIKLKKNRHIVANISIKGEELLDKFPFLLKSLLRYAPINIRNTIRTYYTYIKQLSE